MIVGGLGVLEARLNICTSIPQNCHFLFVAGIRDRRGAGPERFLVRDVLCSVCQQCVDDGLTSRFFAIVSLYFGIILI